VKPPPGSAVGAVAFLSNLQRIERECVVGVGSHYFLPFFFLPGADLMLGFLPTILRGMPRRSGRW
jgi:hypothetical protein